MSDADASDMHPALATRAVELRRAFDDGFSRPRRFETTSTQDFLAIRLGAEPYAIRCSEIAGLFVDKKITRVPGQVGALLGVAGFRGAVMPVYDLRTLLGYPAAEAARWLTVASATPVAFVFDAFDAHLRLPHSEISPQGAGENARGHVREFAHAGDGAMPILSLASVLDAISNLAPQAAPDEERR
jgi:chemotaxis signal transduction protein